MRTQEDNKNPTVTTDHLLIKGVAAFAGGVATACYYPWDGTGPGLVAAIVATAIIVLVQAGKNNPGHRLAGLLIFLFLTGLFHALPFFRPPADPNHIYNQIPDRQEVTVSGILQEAPVRVVSANSPQTRLLLAVEYLIRPMPDDQQYRSETIPSKGLVLLTLKGPPPDNLTPGDRFITRAELARPRAFATPGAFDYPAFLAARSIRIIDRIPDRIAIMKLHDLNEPSSFPASLSLGSLPERLRQNIGLFLEQRLAPEVSGLYKAVLIGDKAGVAPQILENFKATGGMHILAISGMHMGLLALITINLTNWLLTRSTRLILSIPVFKASVLLSFLPLATYSLIAGFNPPVIRALIMATVFILALLLNRQKSLAPAIGLAILVILIHRPTSLFTASFQLSFAAVIAIAVIFGRVQPLLFPIAREKVEIALVPRFLSLITKWLLAGLFISIAAVVGTGPLLIYHFNRLSLLSPLSNLLLEPLICFWSLTIGLMASLLIPLAPDLAARLFETGGLGLGAAVHICSWLARLPGATLWLATPSLPVIILYYLLLAALCSRRWRRNMPVLLLLAALLVAVPLTRQIFRRFTDQTTVTFLDVGQGSATVIELPKGKTVLVDGGGPLSERFNVGERVIARFLWHKGISRLDQVVVSHPHGDHYNGLPFILKHFSPQGLWLNGQPSTVPLFTDLLELARHEKIAIKTPIAATTIVASDQTRLNCLANPWQSSSPEHSGINRNSLVLQLHTSGPTFLLPGDIDQETELELVRQDKDLGAAILLGAHHGSRTSSSRKFLEAVAPGQIIFSVGHRNSFNYPDPLIVKRCRDLGIEVRNTARDGAIAYTIAREGKLRMKAHRLRQNSTRRYPAP